MFSIRVHIFIIVLVQCFFAGAQERFITYVEPDLSLNYDVVRNYSHNFKISQRSYIYKESSTFEARQLDISHFSELQVSFGQSVALGIQYRFRNIFESHEENELRFTQQYNLIHRGGTIRMASRLRTEQRISASLTTHRFRLRFAVDTPLNGEKLDVGETYFIASTESLLSVARSNKPALDQRVTIQLGWLLTEKTKVQIGTEYRSENYTQDIESVLFFLTSLVFGL